MEGLNSQNKHTALPEHGEYVGPRLHKWRGEEGKQGHVRLLLAKLSSRVHFHPPPFFLAYIQSSENQPRERLFTL